MRHLPFGKRIRQPLPEAHLAQIEGTFSAQGTLLLPSLRTTSTLQLEQLVVSGLGTEALADGMFLQPCTERDGTPKRIINGPGSRFWMPLDALGELLPAAVLAAEDQRFFEHPGYDPQEIALDRSDGRVLFRSRYRG